MMVSLNPCAPGEAGSSPSSCLPGPAPLGSHFAPNRTMASGFSCWGAGHLGPSRGVTHSRLCFPEEEMEGKNGLTLDSVSCSLGQVHGIETWHLF